MNKFLSSFEPAGLVRKGDSFVSPNYDSVEHAWTWTFRLPLETSVWSGWSSSER